MAWGRVSKDHPFHKICLLCRLSLYHILLHLWTSGCMPEPFILSIACSEEMCDWFFFYERKEWAKLCKKEPLWLFKNLSSSSDFKDLYSVTASLWQGGAEDFRLIFIYMQFWYKHVSHILKRPSEKTRDAKILMKKHLNRNFENIENVTENSLSEVFSSFSDNTCMFCSGSLLQTLENNYREQLWNIYSWEIRRPYKWFYFSTVLPIPAK